MTEKILPTVLQIDGDLLGFQFSEDFSGCGGCELNPGTFRRGSFGLTGRFDGEYKGCMGKQTARHTVIDTGDSNVVAVVEGGRTTPCRIAELVRARRAQKVSMVSVPVDA